MALREVGTKLKEVLEKVARGYKCVKAETA